MNATSQKETKPNRQEIAQKAYQLWEQDGRKAGQDKKYWFLAEKELCATCQSTSTAPPPQVQASGAIPWPKPAGKNSRAHAR